MSAAMLRQHDLSAAFPSMSAEDFVALRDSIESVGVLNPITLFDGAILDGWHRYSAANELGMPCPTVELGAVDPRDFVLALNKSRRHCNAAQLALSVTAVWAWKPEGNPAFTQLDTECPVGKSTAELAAIAGVHPSTIKQAKTVHAKGVEAVKAAVRRGDVGLPKAAAIARLPEQDQAGALAKTVPGTTGKAISTAVGATGPAPDTAELGEQLAEMARNLAETLADNESMARVFEADDKVAAAVAEAKRYREQVRVLDERVRGLQAELNAAIRQAKAWRRKAEATA